METAASAAICYDDWDYLYGSSETHIGRMRYLQTVQTGCRETEKNSDLPAKERRAGKKLFHNSTETSVVRRSARTISARSSVHGLRRAKRDDGKMPLGKREITSTLPAVGPRSNFTYNESGSPTSTSTTYHIDGGPVTLWQFTTYDAESRVTGTSQRITEAGATRTLWGESTEYTSTGQVLRETDRFGRLTEYTYDLRGQTIQTRSQSEDENGVTQWLVSRTVYDSQGRAVVQTGQFVEGAAVTSGCSGPPNLTSEQ